MRTSILEASKLVEALAAKTNNQSPLLSPALGADWMDWSSPMPLDEEAMLATLTVGQSRTPRTIEAYRSEVVC